MIEVFQPLTWDSNVKNEGPNLDVKCVTSYSPTKTKLFFKSFFSTTLAFTNKKTAYNA